MTLFQLVIHILFCILALYIGIISLCTYIYHVFSSCCLPTSMTLASEGVRSYCLWSASQLLGPSGQQCSHSSGVFPQIQGSTLCKYDLRKGDLFVLRWARVRRVRRESIPSELLMCGGGVRSILLLHLVARCLEIIDVCIWRMFVLCLL